MSDNNEQIDKQEETIWPKGRKMSKRLPKFGSNRNPATIPNRWIKNDDKDE